MADNTRMKEFAAELRRQAKMLEKSDEVHTARFKHLEVMQKASETRFQRDGNNVR